MASATLFFGIVPTDRPEVNADQMGESFAKPWRFTDPRIAGANDEQALAYAALGTATTTYSQRNAACNAAPVELLDVVNHRTGEVRYVLAVKASISRAFPGETRFVDGCPIGPLWLDELRVWADKLVIPVARRGAPGWHIFASE